MAVTDQEIELTDKEIHSSNKARPSNRKIFIPSNATQHFKAVIFKLKERKKCRELPNGLVLQSIDIAQPHFLHKSRKESLDMIAHRKNQSFSDMPVPKLTRNNFEYFELDFQGDTRRQVGLYVILIDYLLLRNDTGKYDAVWKSREDKLNNCVIFVGNFYNKDSKILYNLLAERVVTSVPGSNIIAKHKSTKNGRHFYLDLNSNFLTKSHDQTKYQRAENIIS